MGMVRPEERAGQRIVLVSAWITKNFDRTTQKVQGNPFA
jgi:hypothetical protein